MLPRAPNFRVDGQRALVTGASRGVGLAAAVALAQAGAAVTLVARSETELQQACHAIRAEGGQCDYLVLDVTDSRAVAVALGALAPVQILVNNAGMNRPKPLVELEDEDIDAVLDLNVKAAFYVTRVVARHLLAAKLPGSIINIITRSSHGGQPFLTAYSASKGALATLTKNNAHALRADRIRVNGINIGWTDTPGEHAIQARDGRPADWLAQAEPSQPFGRLIKPDDVSTLAVYLLSDASQMMTGALIDFDQNVMGAYD